LKFIVSSISKKMIAVSGVTLERPTCGVYRNSAASTLDLNGEAIRKGAKLWYAFVLASVRLLRTGGCLAFVLPSAGEFADYR